MKKNKVTMALYIIAAIMAVIFIAMIIYNVVSVKSYCTAYGMTIADMGSEAYTYIVSGSAPYLIYAALMFAAAYVVDMVSSMKAALGLETPAAPQVAVVETPCTAMPEVEGDTIAEAVAAAAEEATQWSMDKVPPLYTSKSFIRH